MKQSVHAKRVYTARQMRQAIFSGAVLLGVLLLVGGCSKKEAVGAYSRQFAADEAAMVGEEAKDSRSALFYGSSTSMEWEGTGFSDDASSGMSGAGQAGAALTEAASRKLVSTTNLRLRLTDLDAGGKRLAEFMGKYGVYSASTNVYENSQDFTLKVPSVSYKPFLADLMGMGKEMGKIVSYSERTEDVTIRYYDLESRLATQRELLKTFRSYLGKALSVEDILSVEKRIAELQNEIDSTGTQFRALANLVDYATINLVIMGSVSVPEYEKLSMGERVADLFGGFGDYASALLVGLIGIVIYGVPILLILALLFWLLFGRIGLLKKLLRLVSGKK